MLRDEWEFEVTISELREACLKKLQHHTDRKTWWQAERENAQAALKTRGLDIRENQFTGGANYEAVVDPQLAKRLHECDRKLGHHDERIRDFQMWERALARKSGTLTLDIADVEFFGL